MDSSKKQTYNLPYKNKSISRYPYPNESIIVVFYPSIVKIILYLVIFFCFISVFILYIDVLSFPFFGKIGEIIFILSFELLLLGSVLCISFYLLESKEYYITPELFVYSRFANKHSSKIQVSNIIRIDVETTVVERICNIFIADEIGHLEIYTCDGEYYSTGCFEDPQTVSYEILAQQNKVFTEN